jgi:hypothetical protein
MDLRAYYLYITHRLVARVPALRKIIRRLDRLFLREIL